MASNTLVDALDDLKKVLLPLVKGYFQQEAPERLLPYYERYLQSPNIKPDRISKSGRRYYSEPNKTDKLRTLYGNLQRALTPDSRFPGNITEVTTNDKEVILLTGIDTDAKVKAGGRQTTLAYVAMNQAKDRGRSTSRARPFQDPGVADFQKQEMPKILKEISQEITRYYSGR